jgi:hypothetical protein
VHLSDDPKVLSHNGGAADRLLDPSLGLRVQGLGSRVQGLGFRVQGSRFMV